MGKTYKDAKVGSRLASKYKAYQKTKSKTKHKSKEYEEPDSLRISY